MALGRSTTPPPAFKQKKPAPQRSELTHLRTALKRFGGRAIEAINPPDIEAMIVAELEKRKAPDTIRDAVAALSAVLRFCVDRQIIARNPCIGVPRPKVKKSCGAWPRAMKAAAWRF